MRWAKISKRPTGNTPGESLKGIYSGKREKGREGTKMIGKGKGCGRGGVSERGIASVSPGQY